MHQRGIAVRRQTVSPGRRDGGLKAMLLDLLPMTGYWSLDLFSSPVVRRGAMQGWSGVMVRRSPGYPAHAEEMTGGDAGPVNP